MSYIEFLQNICKWHFAYSSVADADLQIIGGGGGHQGQLDPEMGGGGSQFGLKIRGERAGPPGPSPVSATVLATV